MYKLNNISVINAEKIKIGKDSFNCNINSKVVVYIARMAESKKDIKIVLDEYTILKTDYGFSLSLISDAIDAVVFNKNTQLCKHLNMLETIAYTSNYAGINKKNVEKIGKNFIDVAAALEQSDMVIIYNDEAVENFVRRYIAMMKPSICERAPVVIDRFPEKLIPYLDKLDVVEKVMIETSPANLAYQLENNMFDANISVNILPLKTLQKLTKMNVNEERIKLVANYVQSGRGTVEEVDLMLRWTVAIKKLYEKTTGYHANSGSVHAIIDVMQYGFTITEIITKVSTELMCKSDITHLEGNELLRMLAMRKERMSATLDKRIREEKRFLNQIAESRVFSHPEQLLDGFRMRVADREDRLERALNALLTQKKNRMAQVSAKLEGLSPLSVLARGYAAIGKEGKTVQSAFDVAPGDTLDIRFSDGTVRASVERKEELNG